MTKFARIERGKVVEIFTGDALFPMHPSLAATWRKVPDSVELNWLVNEDTFTAPPTPSVSEINAKRIRLIKTEAQRRITDRYEPWKQTNMIARGVELQDVWRQNGRWTEAEAAEAAALQAAWDWIKAVRTRSDVLEADPSLDITTGWPE